MNWMTQMEPGERARGAGPEQHDTSAQRLPGLPPEKVARVHELVRAHLEERLPVERLAAEVQLSPFHFARMFKQATGESPHRYLLLQRVARAKALLRDSDLPLAEIARRVGFRTQGHFTGVFHRYAGLTPRVYRVRSRNGSMPLPSSEAEDSEHLRPEQQQLQQPQAAPMA
ncbi:MAG TPA: helix-turn-helix domain-containing protein [Burkholderiaceae bacterium]|nr:helix-turn-helix domain-containing protein [Burkholderiaceae bacterium]